MVVVGGVARNACIPVVNEHGLLRPESCGLRDHMVAGIAALEGIQKGTEKGILSLSSMAEVKMFIIVDCFGVQLSTASDFQMSTRLTLS